MTLPTSILTLINIQTEFGGAVATSLNEYYRGSGTGYVPYYQPSTSYGMIPSASTISMGTFRGVTKATVKYVYISANVNNYVFNTAKVAGYIAGRDCARLVILPGVVVGSASVGSYALDIDTSWNTYDVVEVINQGYIVGKGGTGGGNTGYATGGAGGAGGPALRIQRMTNFQNTGVIGGGGGGGGQGGGGSLTFKGTTSYYAGGGGGGGAGYGAGGAGDASGSAGGATTAGAGGASTSATSGGGGSGGALGAAGGAGAAYDFPGGAGGAAGIAVVGQANTLGGTIPGTVYGTKS